MSVVVYLSLQTFERLSKFEKVRADGGSIESFAAIAWVPGRVSTLVTTLERSVDS